MVVDYILSQTYEEVDLDEDPVIVPDCGHLITVSSLDGHMDMKKHYDVAEDNTIRALEKNDEPFSTAELKFCPTCRGTLNSIRRYARITRRAFLDEATKKFLAWAGTHLSILGQTLVREVDGLARIEVLQVHKKSLTTAEPYLTGDLNLAAGVLAQAHDLRRMHAPRHRQLVALLFKIESYRTSVQATEQPFRRVFDLVETLRSSGNDITQFPLDNTLIVNGFELKAVALYIRCALHIMKEIFEIRRLTPSSTMGRTNVDFTQNIKACQRLIDQSGQTKLIRQTTEGHIFAAEYQALMMKYGNGAANSGMKDTALRHLDEAERIIASEPDITAGMSQEVESARLFVNDGVFYRPITNEELRDVYLAMAQGFGGTG